MNTILFHQFVAYVAEAFVLGCLICAERQWRLRTAGLRTNALVALGAAVRPYQLDTLLAEAWRRRRLPKTSFGIQ